MNELPQECRNLNGLVKDLSANGPYAIINASGYIGNDSHIVAQYRAMIEQFGHAGLRIIFLPHVIRGSSDLQCLRELHQHCETASVLIDSLLTPAQVTELAHGADIVVTGRMHLAVLSSLARTPVLTLATQGKVDGLYKLLGHPDWVLDSKGDFSSQVAKTLENIRGTIAEYPSADALSRINQLARAPFSMP